MFASTITQTGKLSTLVELNYLLRKFGLGWDVLGNSGVESGDFSREILIKASLRNLLRLKFVGEIPGRGGRAGR